MTATESVEISAAGHIASEERLVLESSPRRVRVVLGGETIADSPRMVLLHEKRHLPVYYFPMSDVAMDFLQPTEHTSNCPYKGDARYWSVRAGDAVAENAVWNYPQPVDGARELAEYIAFYWDRMDAWFEEDEEIFVHARDPYKRIDVIRSKRHVKVVLAGEVVAESRRVRFLFETGLPTRYYMPAADVRTDLLRPSETHTRCPYKGEAAYFSAAIGDSVVADVVWAYRDPVPECPKIKDYLCFFNERVDAIFVDGEEIATPTTPWS